MQIITKNGKIDYQNMLLDITRQERRWQETMLGLPIASELHKIARQELESLQRMKIICQDELSTHII